MTRQDLKLIQKHLLGQLVALKTKSINTIKVEEIAELEVEIISIKGLIKKIGDLLK